MWLRQIPQEVKRMDDNQTQNPNQNADDTKQKKQPEIIVNEYGTTKDSAVVIEEDDRTVLLTEDETIIIEKQETIDLAPKNRPRKVYAGMWGSIEIATAGLGLMAVLTAILLFIFIVIPSEKQLEANKDKRDKLDTELTATKKKYDKITNTEAEAAKLVESVQDFETRFLRPPSIGQTAIYQRINGLINAYGLTNTTGPDYIPLEIAGRQSGSRGGDAERGREKFQSLFPGVYVTMTVEGSYQNLRRFIREIETSEQFIVISAIELEPSEKDDRQQNETQTIQAQINNAEVQPLDEFGNPTGQSVQAAAIQNKAPQSSRGRVRGQTVNLTIEMAAYFRRPDFQTIEPVNTSAQ